MKVIIRTPPRGVLLLINDYKRFEITSTIFWSQSTKSVINYRICVISKTSYTIDGCI